VPSAVVFSFIDLHFEKKYNENPSGVRFFLVIFLARFDEMGGGSRIKVDFLALLISS
jgi:hypothetical protein